MNIKRDIRIKPCYIIISLDIHPAVDGQCLDDDDDDGYTITLSNINILECSYFTLKNVCLTYMKGQFHKAFKHKPCKAH